MSARRITTSLAAAGALLALAAPADAASAATYPSITKVSPLQVKIGETLTITGKGFVKGKGKTTVVFRRTGKRSIFATANATSTTKLTVVVPTKLAAVLGKQNGQPVASRFQLRILAKRFGKKYTTLKASPVISPVAAAPAPAAPGAAATPAGTAATPAATPIVAPTPPAPPADTDADGTPDYLDTDDDGDLLLDATEAIIGTDPLYKDTDGDGLEDGWEYKSATDLKARSCQSTDDYPVPCDAAMPDPVPGAHYYPNPLDPTDSTTDFDGDSLSAAEEHAAWLYRIGLDPSKRTLTTLWYSDGLQASIDTAPEPNLCRGMAVPEPFDGNGVRPEFGRRVTPLSPITYPDVTQAAYADYTLDNIGAHAYDGCLDDAERDEDGDFLNNWTEQHGPMLSPSWWNVYDGEVQFGEVRYAGTNWLDPNTDKRGPVDGLDDADNDDFLNIEEVIGRGAQSRNEGDADVASGGISIRSGLWTHAFNPCLPSPESRTCPTTFPAGKARWAPFPQKDGTVPVPRWPLYGTYIYNPHDPGPAPADPLVDTSTPEQWNGPSGLPPVHPLPR